MCINMQSGNHISTTTEPNTFSRPYFSDKLNHHCFVKLDEINKHKLFSPPDTVKRKQMRWVTI